MVAAVSPDDDAFPLSTGFQFDDEGGGVVLEGACVFGGFGNLILWKQHEEDEAPKQQEYPGSELPVSEPKIS
jgi:hypothetical protein